MSLQLKIIPRTFHFKQPAGTSRGIYTERKVWFIELSGNSGYGLGECASLPGLSTDYETVQAWLENTENSSRLADSLEKELNAGKEETGLEEVPLSLSSLRFAVEIAYLHYRKKGLRFWDTPFSRGEAGIPFNGLIWMGTYEEMFHRIREKTEAGFHCLKLKIGSLDFEKELELLHHLRTQFSPSDLELRVDANGAFSTREAPFYLKKLAELDLHSIEQPIPAGHWKEMAQLCRHTPLPIALDEELIGIDSMDEKKQVLDCIHPQYIVLKPSLHGGMRGTREWISLAVQRGIGWWITSALESNVGLNAIAQLCGLYEPTVPQGLGTGQLYTDNTESPLLLKGDRMYFHPDRGKRTLLP